MGEVSVKRSYKLGSAFPSEGFVQSAIERYFLANGFEVDTSGHIDLLCSHPKRFERWHIEAKGKTSQIGLDFRTCLGQLVQQIREDDVHYGVALPNLPEFERQVSLVNPRVTEGLHIHWLLVSADGSVSVRSPRSCSAFHKAPDA